MAKDGKQVDKAAKGASVDAFLQQVAATPTVKPAETRGRLLFAMDATASRESTWDTACQIQGDMFAETTTLGGLDVQLAYYRGFKEFRATPWVSGSADLIPFMSRVRCQGGHTQLERVLKYAAKESTDKRVNAFVFVGDCLEEPIDDVCAAAGELALLGVPCFMFHEGDDLRAMGAFKQISEITRGAFCRFDLTSARQLRELLAAVAVYAAGGRRALAFYGDKKGGAVLKIAHQVGSGGGR
jgi:hypothetical protein